MDLKTDRISTKNFRIQAQVLNFPTSKLLWMNTYFPTDKGGDNFDEEELHIDSQTKLQHSAARIDILTSTVLDALFVLEQQVPDTNASFIT